MTRKDGRCGFRIRTALHRARGEIAEHAARRHDNRKRDRELVGKLGKEPGGCQRGKRSRGDETADQAFNRLARGDRWSELMLSESPAGEIRTRIRAHQDEKKVAEKVC